VLHQRLASMIHVLRLLGLPGFPDRPLCMDSVGWA
jgi:hypothetical protein